MSTESTEPKKTEDLKEQFEGNPFKDFLPPGVVDETGSITPRGWFRVCIFPAASILWWVLAGALFDLPDQKFGIAATITIVQVVISALIGLVTVLMGIACCSLGFRQLGMLQEFQHMRAVINEGVRRLEMIEPTARNIRATEAKAALRLAEMLANPDATKTEIVEMRRLQRQAAENAEMMEEKALTAPIKALNTTTQLDGQLERVRRFTAGASQGLESVFYLMLSMFPVIISLFAGIFQLFYILRPVGMDKQQIASNFDFFYYSFLTATTIDVPSWQGMPIRITLVVLMTFGLCTILGLVSSLLALLHRRFAA